MRVNTKDRKLKITSIWNRLKYNLNTKEISGYILTKNAMATVKASINDRVISVEVIYNGYCHLYYRKTRKNITVPGAAKIASRLIKETIKKEANNQSVIKFK